MNDAVLRRELRRIAIEANHRCFGCGFEDSCGTRGCAIIRQALERLELYGDAMPLERARELAQAEKDGRRLVQKPPIPGDTVWIIERDKYEEPIEISGYMFFAFVGRAVIVSSYINDYETLDETVEYHIEETLNNYDTDLAVFPKNDCYLTREEAEAALKKREADNETD